MRPVFLFFIDGLNVRLLKEHMKLGLMPNFSRIFGGGAIFDRVMTSFPSVTGPAHVPLLVGEMPYHNEIVGHNNHRRKLNRFDNLLLYYKDFASYFETKPTLFDAFENPVSIGLPLSKGARYRANRLALLEWFWIPHLTEANAMRIALQEAKRGSDLVAVWLHEMDTNQHIRSSPHRITSTFQYLDTALGEAESRLPKDTIFSFCTDHGNEWTPNFFSLRRFLRGLLQEPFLLNLDGGGYVQLFFRPKKITEQLRYEEVKNIKTTSSTPLLDAILSQEAIALAWTRDGTNVRVMSRDGYATIERDGNLFRYHPVTSDVFLYQNDSRTAALVDTWVSHETSLLTSFDHAFPDAIPQGYELVTHHNAADLILTNRSSWSLNLLCPNSVHGGINREQMHSVFGFSEPVGDPNAIVHSTAFPHLLLELAGRPALRTLSFQA